MEFAYKIDKGEIKMKITITPITESKRILDKCRLTVNKEPSKNPRPSTVFLDNIYMSEHSPIREKVFDIYIEDIPYCISTHYVRHHVGCEKFVTTSRSDRTDVKDRSQRSQMDLVNMSMTINAQSLINLAKVRLCYCADKDARKVMFEIVRQIKEIEPELGNKLVPNCIYRGFCSENNKESGYSKEFLRNWRKEYLNGRETF